MSENIKILLVDDEYDIALAFSLGLQSNGFSVDTFNNPIEALCSFKVYFYKFSNLNNNRK